jgi:hypothetical protein
MTHWIIDQQRSTPNEPIIIQCSGCYINNCSHNLYETHLNLAINPCINTFSIFEAVTIPNECMKCFNKHNRSAYLLNIPLFEILQTAEFHTKFLHGILPYTNTPVPHTPQYNLINRYIEKGPVRNILHSSQEQFRSSLYLEFYTDGSVINLGKESISTSISFLQTGETAPRISFSATIDLWPTASRAELFAIFAALLTAPLECSVTIFTDSKSSIDKFNSLH